MPSRAKWLLLALFLQAKPHLYEWNDVEVLDQPFFLRKNGPSHSCLCWGTHELGTSIHPNKTIPSNLRESDLQ